MFGSLRPEQVGPYPRNGYRKDGISISSAIGEDAETPVLRPPGHNPVARINDDNGDKPLHSKHTQYNITS